MSGIDFDSKYIDVQQIIEIPVGCIIIIYSLKILEALQ